MGNVEQIYLSKLEHFHNVLATKASKCQGANGAFADMLESIENRLGTAGSNGTSAFIQGSADPYSAAEYLQNPINYIASPYAQSPVSEELQAMTTSNTDINNAIAIAAQTHDIDPNLLRAVIMTESSFRPGVSSGCGAQGLMQLMPGTAKELGVQDAYDPYQNVNGGAKYLKKQIKRFGDVRLALAAYNNGPSRIAKLDISDPNNVDEYSKIAKGVRGYVAKIMGLYEKYSQAS